jgi:hypothetical protein
MMKNINTIKIQISTLLPPTTIPLAGPSDKKFKLLKDLKPLLLAGKRQMTHFILGNRNI